MAPMIVTLNDFGGHSPIAGLYKCNAILCTAQCAVLIVRQVAPPTACAKPSIMFAIRTSCTTCELVENG